MFFCDLLKYFLSFEPNIIWHCLSLWYNAYRVNYPGQPKQVGFLPFNSNRISNKCFSCELIYEALERKINANIQLRFKLISIISNTPSTKIKHNPNQRFTSRNDVYFYSDDLKNWINLFVFFYIWKIKHNLIHSFNDYDDVRLYR